ncbi:MAG: DEAD/DEAH box helicase family protein [Verrucomicrobiota bacterium]
MATDVHPKCFPQSVRCRLAWRPYQERVLAELEAHLEDRHFHVVAAPGSGKTVLGLEAVRRVGKPALIFAPTLAIRDQWIRRFLDSFWHGPERPDWISTELAHPRLLTVVTYQSLTHFEKHKQTGELAGALKTAGVETLVFDEAHHLRNQWWKTLDAIKDGLGKPFVIALTATPPYDVAQVEWNRYANICGEVDEEISAPELVKAKNLCPHQDFIYCCEPTEMERAALEKFFKHTDSFLRDLALNQEVVQAVQNHPVLKTPEAALDVLLEESDYYLSLAIFLKHAAGVAPPSLLQLMGLEEVPLPPFNRGWAEVMLNGMLFTDRESFIAQAETLKRLQQELTACGAIERRTVLLRSSAHNNKLLRSSVSKLHGIADIVELERRVMDWRLRLLILTDFIREEDFPGLDGVEKKFTKLGVVPIFEHLRRLRLPNLGLGILTGRLVVIPRDALKEVEAVARKLGVPETEFTAQELWHDPAYLRLEFASGESGPMLEIITRLFAEGEINVLIGTAALLGEGWDAPAVNTLVMATVIGSYVSSNQIRGRAIRVDPQHEFKCANIWHLACVAPVEAGADEGGVTVEERDWERETDDITLLRRRFRAFVGLRFDEPMIENGIERIGVDGLKAGQGIGAFNARMCREAEKREAMAEQWQKAIFHPQATHARVVHEVFVPIPRIPSHPVLRHWLRNERGWFGWMRAWMLERKVRRIADALLASLKKTKVVSDRARGVEVSLGKNSVRVRLPDVSCREESIFVEALREVFDPLQSPRYLLVTKDEEFAVPRALAERKERAELFLKQWRRHVANADLLYAYTPEGKRRLLRAKERHLAAKFHYATESKLRWG